MQIANRRRLIFRPKMSVPAAILFGSMEVHAASPRPACQLLTQEQVAAALGVSVDAGSPVPMIADSCVWKESGKTLADAPVLVQLQLLSAQQFERIKMVRAAQATPQSALGGEAYSYKDPITGYQLLVKTSHGYFVVVCTLPLPRYAPGAATDEKCKTVEATIARAVAGNL